MKKLLLLPVILFLFACSDVTGDYDAEYGDLFSEYGDADSSADIDSGKTSSSSRDHKPGSSSSTDRDTTISSSNDGESSSSSVKSESEGDFRFNSDIQYRTFVDSRDKKIYKTVIIGNQLWMAENLNFADTICVPALKKGSSCYGGEAKNCKIYGRLYTFSAALETCSDSSTSKYQGVCPDNWHVPNNADWKEFVDFVTTSAGKDRVGNSLKSLDGWDMNSKGAEGSDVFGFRILPGGLRDEFGNYKELGGRGAFWSAYAMTGSADSYELVTASIYGKKDSYVASLEDKGHDYGYSLSIRCVSDSLACNGVTYDVKKKFCVDGKLYQVCNGNNYDPLVYTCFKDSVVKIADTSKFTCGTESLNIATQFCGSDLKVYPLCGGSDYEVKTEFCSSGTVVALCSGAKFDPAKEKCVNDTIRPLCGTEAYDPGKSFCGSDTKVHPLCGGESYEVSQKFCSSDSVYTLCSGDSYDPTAYVCSGSKLKPLCGVSEYNPSTEFCANNEKVYPLCSGEQYDVAVDSCDNGALVKKLSFNSDIQYRTFTDNRDYKVYKSVVIGNQLWMAENLNFADTICVPDLKKQSACYGNESRNCKYFGRLYSYSGASKTCSDAPTTYQGLCPDNWHIPTRSEWKELIAYVTKFVGKDRVGNSLKSLDGWNLNSKGAEGTDDFGLRILPSGIRNDYGSFDGLYGAAYFWVLGYSVGSAYTYELRTAYVYGTNQSQADASFSEGSKYGDNFLSVRCISDSLVCGGVVFDTHEKFCVEDTLYPLCGGDNYDPAVYTCSDGAIVKKPSDP